MHEQKLTRRSALGALGLGLLMTPGCASLESVATAPEPENYSKVSVGSGYVESLNQWLRTNPGKRVTSVAGILAYREGCSSFVIQHEPGDNERQRFVLLRPDISTIQNFRNSHKEEEVIALTSIPAYSGGVKNWLLCVERKPDVDNQ
jgi:hypothetical protein